MSRRTAALVAVIAALVNLQLAQGYVHTNIGSSAETTLSDDCQSQYNDLLASIPVPPEPLLDAGELNCTDQISNATANTDGVYCPSQAVLVACFQVISSSTCILQGLQTQYLISSEVQNCISSTERIVHPAAEPHSLDQPGWQL